MGDAADNDPEAIRKFKEDYSTEEDGVFRAASYGQLKIVQDGT